ncbi:hypothetical protein MSG28_004085 [Choristoneura fumiferana]|uniref:Uncharacterized protein n=1 Tax=Choristoneura fumiferana TaxID=7141 RepID=A0ACC0KI27_CHOFU|nr:hypothetical protein MSG28_004085 [Choristoneura fumiferana]
MLASRTLVPPPTTMELLQNHVLTMDSTGGSEPASSSSTEPRSRASHAASAAPAVLPPTTMMLASRTLCPPTTMELLQNHVLTMDSTGGSEPASSSSTEPGSRASRAASAAPAVPPPTTTNYCSSVKMTTNDDLSSLDAGGKIVKMEGADMASTARILVAIVQICFEAKNWTALNDQIVLLSKRRTITEGKIYVEVERARLTHILAKIREDDGNVAEAAKIIQELQVETYGSMSKREKVELILEQMRLCLAIKDYVRTQIISKKINTKFFEEEDTQELKEKFYRLMIAVDQHNGAYLSVCRHFRALGSAGGADALTGSVVFLVLAPYDNEQADLTHRLNEDKELDKLPEYKQLLGLFINPEIIKWNSLLNMDASDRLNEWSNNLNTLMQLVNKTTHLINKEECLIVHLRRLRAVDTGRSDDGTIQIHEQDEPLEQKYNLGDYPLVAGEELLLTPLMPDTRVKQNDVEAGEYRAQGISITNFLPMRSWEIAYKGEMKTKADAKKTVELSVVWSAHFSHFNYDSQMSPRSMANDMAREPWSRDYFKLLQKYHQSHYEQMGHIEGSVTIDGKTQNISMPCVRDHSFGKYREWRNFHRYVLHFIFLENGDCMAVGSVSQPAILSHLTIGYVCRKADQTIYPVEKCTQLR